MNIKINITPDSYRKRIQKYDIDFPWGEDAIYNPPCRTPDEIANREIDTEEHIAIRLLADIDHNGFTSTAISKYIQAIISDPNYAKTPYDADIKLPRRSDFTDTYDDENTTIKYNNYTYAINFAQFYLASAIVQHRLYGFSGSERTIGLGFGINISTSLAAEIVDYHNRICNAIHGLSRESNRRKGNGIH